MLAYCKLKKCYTGSEINIKLLQTQRQGIINQLAPYQELGRGRMGLTRTQTQQASKLKYQLDELDRTALSSLVKQGSVDSTTGGPFSRSYNDMVVKNLWWARHEKNIGGYWSSPGVIAHLGPFLQLEENQRCLGLFYMGYYDEAPRDSERLPLDEVVRYFDH